MVIIDKLSNPTPKQQKVLDRMSKTPVLKILLLAVTWLALFGITFVRGGGESDLSHMGVHKCSQVFWLLGAALVVVMGLVGLFAAIYVFKSFTGRQTLEIPLMVSYTKSSCQLRYFVLIPV
jgi:multisubunit Na+/H+ antiporter MnhB subunit